MAVPQVPMDMLLQRASATGTTLTATECIMGRNDPQAQQARAAAIPTCRRHPELVRRVVSVLKPMKIAQGTPGDVVNLAHVALDLVAEVAGSSIGALDLARAYPTQAEACMLHGMPMPFMYEQYTKKLDASLGATLQLVHQRSVYDRSLAAVVGFGFDSDGNMCFCGPSLGMFHRPEDQTFQLRLDILHEQVVKEFMVECMLQLVASDVRRNPTTSFKDIIAALHASIRGWLRLRPGVCVSSDPPYLLTGVCAWSLADMDARRPGEINADLQLAFTVIARSVLPDFVMPADTTLIAWPAGLAHEEKVLAALDAAVVAHHAAADDEEMAMAAEVTIMGSVPAAADSEATADSEAADQLADEDVFAGLDELVALPPLDPEAMAPEPIGEDAQQVIDALDLTEEDIAGLQAMFADPTSFDDQTAVMDCMDFLLSTVETADAQDALMALMRD